LELDDTSLGRRVHGGGAEAEYTAHRADRQDLSAAAAFQFGVDRLAAREHSGQVRVDDRVPLVEGVGLGRLPNIDARVGNQNI
jgi:hypothetical protein